VVRIAATVLAVITLAPPQTVTILFSLFFVFFVASW
jgi:hypothetical protein